MPFGFFRELVVEQSLEAAANALYWGLQFVVYVACELMLDAHFLFFLKQCFLHAAVAFGSAVL